MEVYRPPWRANITAQPSTALVVWSGGVIKSGTSMLGIFVPRLIHHCCHEGIYACNSSHTFSQLGMVEKSDPDYAWQFARADGSTIDIAYSPARGKHPILRRGYKRLLPFERLRKYKKAHESIAPAFAYIGKLRRNYSFAMLNGVTDHQIRQLYIGIVRDPRDIAVSFSKVGNRSRNLHDLNKLSAAAQERVAVWYCREATEKTVAHFKMARARGGHATILFYEELVTPTDKARHGKKILSDLGLSRACNTSRVARQVAISTQPSNIRKEMQDEFLWHIPIIRSAGKTSFREELSAAAAKTCTETMRAVFAKKNAAAELRARYK